MAALRAFGGLTTRLLSRNKPFLYAIRQSHDDLDLPEDYYEPNPKPPKTKKEIEEVAAKYHLHPAEYKPVPEKFNQGDYPDVEHPEHRDPFYPWDYGGRKKMYQETIHSDVDYPARYEPTFPIEPKVAILRLVLVCGSIITMYFLTKDYIYYPIMERQYPAPGKVHYTFERPS